jgi:hypothetical protein
LDKCWAHPQLKAVYETNSKLFTEEHDDWEQLILTVFLVFEA